MPGGGRGGLAAAAIAAPVTAAATGPESGPYRLTVQTGAAVTMFNVTSTGLVRQS